MKNFIYSSILEGGQLDRVGLPEKPRTPVKMPSSSTNLDQKSILDKRQGYRLILDLPIRRNNEGYNKYCTNSITIMGCTYKALMQSEAALKDDIDQEHFYSYLTQNHSNKEAIN